MSKLPPTQQAELRQFVCEDGLEHRIGQAYDERRGTGNGPQICLKCKQTLASLVQAAATQRAIAELEQLHDSEWQKETTWQRLEARLVQLRAQLGGGK